MMTYVQFFCAVRRYGADVLILAAGVTCICALFKRTVMKNCPGKAYFFLPFAVGIVLYAIYRIIATLSFSPIADEPLETLEGGLGCGCAATMYYLLYEQFFRKGKTSFSLSPVLGAFLPPETCESASAELLNVDAALPEEQFRAKIAEVLRKYADPPLPDTELAAATYLISRLLKGAGS